MNAFLPSMIERRWGAAARRNVDGGWWMVDSESAARGMERSAPSLPYVVQASSLRIQGRASNSLL